MSPDTEISRGLEVDDLLIRYGGHVAVKDVTLRAPQGGLTGLIGPNGAGKTTTFNGCSGLLRPSGGVVRLFGQDVSHKSATTRAQLGLGRTFQRMEIWGSLTVAENVAVGCEARLAGSSLWRQLVSNRKQRAVVQEITEEALAICGIEHLAGERAGNLSTGQKRLVELARAYAGQFQFLLLDEPSSGLDHTESARFGEILRHLVDDKQIGILIVEHDMTLVMNICDYLYVLDFGVLIFEGTPAEARVSPVVRSAYLGEEEGLEAAEHEAGPSELAPQGAPGRS